MTDEELLEAYDTAVDAAMDRASERDGFASNMSRESRVAGLRAVERAAAAQVLEEAANERERLYGLPNGVAAWLRARAEAYRQEREEQ